MILVGFITFGLVAFVAWCWVCAVATDSYMAGTHERGWERKYSFRGKVG